MNSQPQTLSGKPISLWLDTTPATQFPSLQGSLTVDVAIVGGGIAGLTAATMLKAEGKTVAVLEAARIVQAVTGNTTAKLTSLHSLPYADLTRRFGENKARAYGLANQAAIETIAELVRLKQIECDFRRTEAYTYTESAEEVERFQAEVEAALKFGLPAALVTGTPLPYSVAAAVRFENQAQFHPRKYLLALAREIPGGGSHVFENTQAREVNDGEPCTVRTEHGDVTAGAVIIASHFPFNDRMNYAVRLLSHRSYVVAVRIAGEIPRGMFISTPPVHSLRTQPFAGGELLLVGGEGHTSGQGDDTVARYQRLEQWARERFDVQSVEYRWATQDNQSIDGVPYIGYYGPTSRNVYVATGFGGWGMTNGTAAGMLLTDLILGRENPAAEVYNPNRVNLTGLPDLARHTADIAKHFVGDRLGSDKPESVAPGEGKIVSTQHGKTAMYRAEDGTVQMVSPVCTHMGCFVLWNPAERSWDCPCHGSRFGTDGQVIQGPAIDCLKAIEPTD